MLYVAAQRATSNESHPHDEYVCVYEKIGSYTADVIKQNVSNNLKLFSVCSCVCLYICARVHFVLFWCIFYLFWFVGFISKNMIWRVVISYENIKFLWFPQKKQKKKKLQFFSTRWCFLFIISNQTMQSKNWAWMYTFPQLCHLKRHLKILHSVCVCVKG